MPLLVNRLIFSIAPTKAPFIIRPLVRAVFSTIETSFINPRLERHAKIVRDPYYARYAPQQLKKIAFF